MGTATHIQVEPPHFLSHVVNFEEDLFWRELRHKKLSIMSHALGYCAYAFITKTSREEKEPCVLAGSTQWSGSPWTHANSPHSPLLYAHESMNASKLGLGTAELRLTEYFSQHLPEPGSNCSMKPRKGNSPHLHASKWPEWGCSMAMNSIQMIVGEFAGLGRTTFCSAIC